jgi:CheY-like chemotaxis protein
MSTQGKRVLLAEDDPEMRRLIRQMLEALGAQVCEASSGVALISRLAEANTFDLVVTDVCMPWVSGAQVVQMARSAGVDVPVSS